MCSIPASWQNENVYLIVYAEELRTLHFDVPQNVLEGIGLLVKRGKNHVSWNENPPESSSEFLDETGEGKEKEKSDSESDGIESPPRIKPKKTAKNSAEYEELKKKLEKLKEEERQVDRYLEYLQEQAAVFNGRQPPSREQLAYLPPGVRNVPEQMYVQFEDITNMPAYKSETVIGIRAPTGTSLEVPDPDQGMKPGERRFEMYLSSKGTEQQSMRGAETKGEPINVYLVQPRADQQSRGNGEHPGDFVEENLQPTPQRSSKTASQEKTSEVAEGRPSSRGRPDHNYNVPPPGRPGEYGQGSNHDHSGNRVSSHRKEPPPLPHGVGSSPSRGHPYPPPDQSWGAHGPYGYGSVPASAGGYYPSHGNRDQRDHRSPGHTYPSHSRMERGEREEGRHSLDRAREFYPPEGGPMRPTRGRGDAFRPRPHHFHPPHEMGRTASSGGDGQTGRPHSPDHLLNMPLQSPSEPYHYPSPSGPGFTPPGGPRESVRAGDVQFPMPTLPAREARDRDYREPSWHPPPPKASKSPPGGNPPRR